MKTHLIIIDPQKDFCDPKNGALFVNGADKDMHRLAQFIQKQGNKLDEIHVTLDSHLPLHIAHPIFWTDSRGNHPTPYTVITRKEVENGEWSPTNPAWASRAIEYVQQLEKNKRYELRIWPPHCIIGSEGHSIAKNVSDALIDWQNQYFATINTLVKGSNIFTEHYSAVKADVPDPADESTKLNTGFIETVKTADRIFITGEALSHCVASTIGDVADCFGEENIKKFILLEDTTSPVSSCEELAHNWIQTMTRRGMQIARSTNQF